MNNRKWITSFGAAAGFIALILDSQTGLNAAREGMELCVSVLIPSMFPFFVLSMVLTGSLMGRSLKPLSPLRKICRIPAGTESLLAIGLLGGYPVGAQNVLASYQQSAISQEDAQRMVVFCNNAGPAFLFGYLGTLFDNPLYPWLIWAIHISSTLLVSWIIPGGTGTFSTIQNSPSVSLPQALNRSIRVMAQVCGWVILFRVLIGFLDRWLFWGIPDILRIFFTGMLDLSNGCILLSGLPSNGLRMILASSFLGFGSICVLLQTHSIAGSFRIPLYLPGKALHGCISFLLAYGIQLLIPDAAPVSMHPIILPTICLCAIFLMVMLRKQEKSVAISEHLLYNQSLCEKRRTICSSGKKSKNPVSTAVSARS